MNKYIFLLLFLMYSLKGSGQSPIYFNFDTIENIYIDSTNPGNIWQIGIPQKPIFNSAFSGQRAILTDTINFYPNNNSSEFIITVPTYSPAFGGVILSFFQKYDSDTLLDGGTIEVSYDGQNWMNIWSSYGLSPGNLFSVNDTVSSLHAPGFSGRSLGWELINLGWNYPPSDTISIKFKFASDGINNNREGWMIDNLSFMYYIGLGMNPCRDLRKKYSLYPNPVVEKATLYFWNPNKIANHFTLINSKGDIIFTKDNIVADYILIDRSGVSNGLYFFYITSSVGNIASGKIVFE